MEFAYGDKAQKQSLQQPILANEQRLESMYLTYKKLIVETRNTEIKYLRTNN